MKADHRGVFVGIDYKHEMSMVVEELPERPGRRLVSKKKKWTKVYLKELHERFEKRDIYQRVENLWLSVERGKISDKQKYEFERLDKYITESMLSAERKIPKKHSRGWSPSVCRTANKICYLRALRRRARGYRVGQNVVNCLK